MSFFIYLKREITPPANRSLDKIISVKCAKKKNNNDIAYAYFLFRYLVPSHCSVCPKVAEQCEVNGCGQQIRREGKEGHLKDNLQRHFDLVTREKGKILWKIKMVSRANF